MSNFKHIDIQAAKELMSSKKVVVLDIRDQQSFNSSHIHGAINVSKDNVNQIINETNKDTPLICCCYHGHSSQNAAAFLVSQGFKEVYSLDGGYAAWED